MTRWLFLSWYKGKHNVSENALNKIEDDLKKLSRDKVKDDTNNLDIFLDKRSFEKTIRLQI